MHGLIDTLIIIFFGLVWLFLFIFYYKNYYLFIFVLVLVIRVQFLLHVFQIVRNATNDNCFQEGGDAAFPKEGDWIQEWSSRPDQLPPK